MRDDGIKGGQGRSARSIVSASEIFFMCIGFAALGIAIAAIKLGWLS